MKTLDLPNLARWLGEHHTRDLVRVETLPHYESASDGEEFARFLRGEHSPDRAAKAGWLDKLRADTATGRAWRRVRVVEPPLTDYVRYSCEWGYTDNTIAGERVRILDLSAAPLGSDLVRRLGDFYVVDDRVAAPMTYDPDGRFVRATPVLNAYLAGAYRAVADAAWRLAVPFTDWWAAHPEHHRQPAA